MTARNLRPSLLLATAVLPIIFLIFPADATTTSPAEQSKAIEQARKGLDASDSERNRAAFACLTEAVATLGAQRNGLRNGPPAFTGLGPKGFKFTKPEREGH